MKITGSIPRSRRMPSLRNVVMIDTVRGVLRVRKWPKKRGTPRSALQRWWIDWFRQANILAKYVDGMSQARAIAITKGSGLYPRDVLLKAMRGRLYHFTDQDGNKWFPMAGIQDISDTLDMLAQNIGSVLVRAVDRWRAAGPPSPSVGDALTYQGPLNPPAWGPVGGAVTIQNLPGTPIIPDGTQTEYDLDVTSYPELEISFVGVGFVGADRPWVELSTDGGATWKNAGADYLMTSLSQTVAVRFNSAAMRIEAGTVASGHYCVSRFSNLQVARAKFTADVSPSGSVVTRVSGIAQFDGPITDLRIRSQGGNNFNAGTIYVVGLLG